MSCKQPREKVCSLRFPRAENPRKNPWIDHINREARRLGISYMSAVGDVRVKASYKKPLRLKKKKVTKGPSVDEELEQLVAYDAQAPSRVEEQEQQNFPSPPRSPIPTRKAKTPDTTKKTMKALLEMSPIKTPDFSKFKPKKIPKFKPGATPPRKNPKSVIRNPKTRIISRKLVEK